MFFIGLSCLVPYTILQSFPLVLDTKVINL